MYLEDLINIVCSGQNIEIAHFESDEVYYNGLVDDFLLEDIFVRISGYNVESIASTNDCVYDDYLRIWVSQNGNNI